MIKFIQGFGVVQALIAFNSMVADVVDEHELITGLRQEGIFFSSVSFSNKMTSGIGTVAAGFALALIDWPTGADVQTAADIGAETIAWLGLIYGPIVSGFALVCVYCYSKYGLNRQRHADIVAELAVLRAERAKRTNNAAICYPSVNLLLLFCSLNSASVGLTEDKES